MLGGISKLSPIENIVLIQQVLDYYDMHASACVEFIMRSYLEYSKSTREALSAEGMAKQIESMLSTRISDHAEKNKRIVSLEYNAALKQGTILSGAPTIYGVRLDVVALAKRVWGNIT